MPTDIKQKGLRNYVGTLGHLDLSNSQIYNGRFIDYEGIVCFRPFFRILGDDEEKREPLDSRLIFFSEGDRVSVKGHNFVYRED